MHKSPFKILQISFLKNILIQDYSFVLYALGYLKVLLHYFTNFKSTIKKKNLEVRGEAGWDTEGMTVDGVKRFQEPSFTAWTAK